VGTVGHLHLGDGAIITAKAGVTKDVPAGQTWRGAPARPIKEQMEMEAHMQQLPQLAKRLKALEEEMALRSPNRAKKQDNLGSIKTMKRK
jgi:UDP-3-O-[3-hydroxymyristoyl] glucosamine N-acyltransferase